MCKETMGVTIPKWNDHVANEDALLALPHLLAVSDGAGGCGVFANEWSQYLIDHLPTESPLASFDELDAWVDGIWEPFYDAHERKAKEGDGMLQTKFYNEGSCATLAVAWQTGRDRWAWMAYGDSVVFHYNRRTGRLEHSFTRLSDFANPPHLVSCKDPLEESGFRSGEFLTDEASVVFAASDALSHYLLMRYELAHAESYREELDEALSAPTANAQLLRVASSQELDFEQEVLAPLFQSAASASSFSDYLQSLWRQGVLDVDDCTLVTAGKI